MAFARFLPPRPNPLPQGRGNHGFRSLKMGTIPACVPGRRNVEGLAGLSTQAARSPSNRMNFGQVSELESAVWPVFRVDRSKRICGVNKAAYDLFGERLETL